MPSPASRRLQRRRSAGGHLRATRPATLNGAGVQVLQRVPEAATAAHAPPLRRSFPTSEDATERVLPDVPGRKHGRHRRSGSGSSPPANAPARTSASSTPPHRVEGTVGRRVELDDGGPARPMWPARRRRAALAPPPATTLSSCRHQSAAGGSGAPATAANRRARPVSARGLSCGRAAAPRSSGCLARPTGTRPRPGR